MHHFDGKLLPTFEVFGDLAASVRGLSQEIARTLVPGGPFNCLKAGRWPGAPAKKR